MADSKYILSSNIPSTVGLSGIYDFRQGILTLPSGSNPPTPIGANISFITPSGKLAIWDGGSWKILSVGGDGGLPSVFDDIIIWMDLGAGSASGTSPTSVVENPSGATTGSFTSPDPTYASVSGNNTWVFTSAAATQIKGFDRYNFAETGPWVHTTALLFRLNAMGDLGQNFMAYAGAYNAQKQWSIRNDNVNNYLELSAGTEISLGMRIDDQDDTCFLWIITISGQRSGANWIGSGAFYSYASKPSGHHQLNWTGLTNVAPTIGSGLMGDFGSEEAPPMNVWSFMGWDRALTISEHQDLITYYSGRGILVA